MKIVGNSTSVYKNNFPKTASNQLEKRQLISGLLQGVKKSAETFDSAKTGAQFIGGLFNLHRQKKVTGSSIKNLINKFL